VSRNRAGTTLIELIAVLSILGIMLGVVGLAARQAPPPNPDAELASRISAARREALHSRKPVVLQVELTQGIGQMLVLPDGSVRADSVLRIDPLSGRRRNAP
jgi:prepilin-type N-terminal cleavage/methylation domain-containing protein